MTRRNPAHPASPASRRAALCRSYVLAARRWGAWRTPVILITALRDEQTREDARKLGAVAILEKPFDVDALRAVLDRLPRRPAAS